MNLSEMLEQYAEIKTYLDDELAKLKPVEKALENLRVAVQAKMNEEGITTAKSRAGHRLTLVNNKNARIVDNEAFVDFLWETGNLGYLQKRVKLDAVLEYLNEHNEPPPGLEVTTINTLRFDRSKR